MSVNYLMYMLLEEKPMQEISCLGGIAHLSGFHFPTDSRMILYWTKKEEVGLLKWLQSFYQLKTRFYYHAFIHDQ